MAAASPAMSPEQANSILEPLKKFAQGIANLSEKPAIAHVKEIGAAAKRTATGAVKKVGARVQSAGLHPEALISTIFEDNPLANAIYGIGADAVSGTLKTIGGGFSAIKNMLFGKNEPLDDIKDDVSKLRKMAEGEAKREKGVVKSQRRASAFSGLEAAEKSEEERRRRRAQATSAFSKGKVDKKTGLMKADTSFFDSLSVGMGITAGMGLGTILQTLVKSIFTGLFIGLPKLLIGKVLGNVIKIGAKFIWVFAKTVFKLLFGGTIIQKGAFGLVAGQMTKLVARSITSVGAFIIDGVLGFFNADNWGTTKFSAVLGAALGGNLQGGSWLGVTGNALKWGLAGMALGSVFPVIGTIIGGLVGAAIGGLLGWIGGEKIARFTDKMGTMLSNWWTEFQDSMIIGIRKHMPGGQELSDFFGWQTSEEQAAEESIVKYIDHSTDRRAKGIGGMAFRRNNPDTTARFPELPPSMLSQAEALASISPELPPMFNFEKPRTSKVRRMTTAVQQAKALASMSPELPPMFNFEQPPTSKVRRMTTAVQQAKAADHISDEGTTRSAFVMGGRGGGGVISNQTVQNVTNVDHNAGTPVVINNNGTENPVELAPQQ